MNFNKIITGRYARTIKLKALIVSLLSSMFMQAGWFNNWVIQPTANATGAFWGTVAKSFTTNATGMANIRTNLRSGMNELRDELRNGGSVRTFLNDTSGEVRGVVRDNIRGFTGDLRAEVGNGGSVRNLINESVGMASDLFNPGGNGANQGEAARGLRNAGREFNQFLGQTAGYLFRQFNRSALTVAGGSIAVITAWYGSKTIWKQIEKKWNTPKLIIESSRKSWLQKLKHAILGTKIKLPTMIFETELQERLDDIISITRNIRKKIVEGKTNVKYRNLLLWGPPGTGKTMFAQKLAKASGMEYVTFSGSSFAKFKKGEDIIAMDELFEWANKSKKGLLIFIDEAEAFLSERKDGDANSARYQLLNNFLNYTGTRSSKFMLVFASNHPKILDKAMGRRIDDLVEFKLPTLDARAQILTLYRDEILGDIKQNGEDFVRSAFEVLDDAKILKMAKETEGLSCGDLEGVINAIRTDSDITEDGLVSDELVNKVVKRAVQKSKDFACSFGSDPIAIPAK